MKAEKDKLLPKEQISLSTRLLGENQPVFMIAEAGVNHNGDIGSAHKLIDAAVEADADAVKFQTYIAEEGISLGAPLAGHHLTNVGDRITHFDLIKRLELPFECFRELKEHCEEKGIIFISTPSDIPSAELLIDLKCEMIKIASSEMSNYPLLSVVGHSRIPVIISTGMSQWGEIEESLDFIGQYQSEVCVLKCTSNYPASPVSINLRGLLKLKEAFPNYLIGFSDHTEGIEISLAAVGFGISIIERHFTLDKNAWGPDHKASLNPDEFKTLVKAVRKVEKALGKRDWEIQEEEKFQRQTMQKSVYARRDLKHGEKVTMQDVKFLRPLGSMTPREYYLKYRDKPIKRDAPQGVELTPEYFN